MSGVSYSRSDYIPSYRCLDAQVQPISLGNRIEHNGDCAQIDGCIEVSHFPTQKVADEAVPYWQWQRIAARVSIFVTGFIATVGFLFLSALQEKFVAESLLATGPVLTIVILGSLIMGTAVATLGAANALDELDHANQELKFWEAQQLLFKEQGVLPDRIAAARTTIFKRGGGNLTESERNLAIGSIITPKEANTLQGPFLQACSGTDFDCLLGRLCLQGEEGLTD